LASKETICLITGWPGEIPGKRHVRFRRPDGGLYSEELMGEEGFVSDSSLLYHVHPPTAIVKSEGMVGAAEEGSVPNHPLMPRHVRTTDLPAGDDLVLGRDLLFANDDVRISFVSTAGPSGLYRNSVGDEAVYIARGRRYSSPSMARSPHVPGTTSWCRAGPFTAGCRPIPV
jgi:hypothetical protein